MEDKNYIVVQGWMVNRLKLSGNDLMVYAVIYGFSQDKKSKFEGSGKYIADSLGITRKAVVLILKKLMDKGYILKFDKIINGCRLCDYCANFDFIPDKNKSEEGSSSKGREKITQGVKNLHRVGNKDTGGNEANSDDSDDNEAAGGREKITQSVKNLHRVGKNNTGGCVNSSHHITKDIYKGAAAAHLSAQEQELKDAILAIDHTFIFRAGFYPKASAFMLKHNLDSGYLAWLYEQCELKNNIDSLDGYFYSVFFQDDVVERYKAVHKPPSPTAPHPPDNINCPVCGTVHDKLDDKCPVCSLPKDSSSTQVSLYLELQTIPLERRIEYMRRENLIYSDFKWDFAKLKTMNDALKKEFGLKVENETPSRSVYSR